MENKEQAYLSESFVKMFSMPNCSSCKYFEVLTVFEYCNLHERVTEGSICNCFRMDKPNA